MRHSLIALALAAVLPLAAACGPGPDNPADGDAGTVSNEPDQDHDTISDKDEGIAQNVDTDGDGTPDYLDDDSDGDGIPDYREAGDDRTDTPPIDSDGDGIPDFRDLDSDDNGIPDKIDGVDDLDNDGIGNFQDLDDDNDTLMDKLELQGTPEAPPDTDGDGIPDYHDLDSDGDTILDAEERASDPDQDNVPSYLDLDSDGDCIPDAIEAGDSDLQTPPRDTDGDNRPDFLDLDSDNDGLPDGTEDANCNGMVDSGESSATNSDTDGDGASDLVEQAAGTDPANPADNPQANGDFVFVVPYQDNPTPPNDTLDFSTNVSQADVAFTVDTTGSMSEEIGNLKSSISSLVGSVRSQIPNTGFAVAEYKDFPTGSYGGAGDQPFHLFHRVMTANTAAGLQSIQNKVNNYAASGGNDGPEAGWEAMYQVATGAGVSVGSASVPAFNPATAFPSSPLAGEETGTIGGVGFRTGSLPIAVWITDACSHNSSLGYAYSFSGAATQATAISALQALSAHVIAVVSTPQTGGCNAGYARMDAGFAVNGTNSIVPPDAWGPAGTRPSNCAVGQCCTGISGAGEAPTGGMCPLLFSVDGTNGNGLGSSVATAIRVLASYVDLDVGGLAQDDPSDSVDAVAAFVDRVEANPSAGAPCASGLTAVDTNADSINDTFDSVKPGTTVCFDVVPKENTTVPALETPQMFKATVVVEGDGVTTLDTRDVYFLVPPVIPQVPVN